MHASNTGANDLAAVQADQAQINNSIQSLNKIAQETSSVAGSCWMDCWCQAYIDGTAVMTGDFSYANGLTDAASIKVNVTTAAEKAPSPAAPHIRSWQQARYPAQPHLLLWE